MYKKRVVYKEKENTIRILFCDYCAKETEFDTKRTWFHCSVCDTCYTCHTTRFDKCKRCVQYESKTKKNDEIRVIVGEEIVSRPFPIIEYARQIGKNTAEFTASDLSRFMRWWMKQPMREDLMKKYVSEQDFRIAQQESQEAEQEVEGEVDNNEVIAELGLTRKDVDALIWGLNELLRTYDFHEWSVTGESLQGIKEALEGV